MNALHPTALIGTRARLGDHNEIGPGCVIEDGAVLGSHNRLWMNVYVGPGTTIGDGNQVHMGAVLREGLNVRHALEAIAREWRAPRKREKRSRFCQENLRSAALSQEINTDERLVEK